MKPLDRNSRDTLLLRAAGRLDEYAQTLEAAGDAAKTMWVRNDAKHLRLLSTYPDPPGAPDAKAKSR